MDANIHDKLDLFLGFIQFTVENLGSQKKRKKKEEKKNENLDSHI